jgi:hypothetical protein
VTRVSTVHDPLCDVYPTASDIPIGVDVLNLIDGARMHAHPQSNCGVASQELADLNSTPKRSLGITKENQRHAVTRGQADQQVFGLSPNELACAGY